MIMRLLPTRFGLSFMSLRWPAFVMSAILVVAAIFMISTRGLNFGIDFAGGSLIEVSQPETVDLEDVRTFMASRDRIESLQVNTARGTGVDAETVIVIRFKPDMDGLEDVERGQQEITDAARDELLAGFPGMELRSSASVGPKVSGELLRAGVTALVVALTLMMVYIWFRFEWQFSLGAVAALAHDVVLTIGLFAALQLEFNLTTIAALLTIIGYSMNDTVVVFDRVREEMRKYKKMPLQQLLDLALNGTLSRTLLTSGTTLLALLAIFFLGGPVLRGMSFALIWGVLIGTYSSIFVASTLLLAIGVEREKKPPEETPGFQAAP